MRNVLVYIEPHPIRNYYEEFYDVGLLLCQAMLQLDQSAGYNFRYLSNDAIVDRIITEAPSLSYLSLRFTSQENQLLENFYGQWNLKTIHEWLSLVKGEGPLCDFYVSVLERVHKEYPFDAVLLWSDNGAVRKFCLDNDIAILHAEYGPTRAPFHQTIYLDPDGTNGAAAVLKAPLIELTPEITVPRETWVTRHGKDWNDEKKVGLIDVATTSNNKSMSRASDSRPYLFIPLQLEDDLNTQLYSKFKTPEAFLRHVIPQALDIGLDVVVKGHPAAVGRTFNLIAQTKALNYARTLGERVTVMPHTATAFESINILAQAAAVATINSSVGFEALLLGKVTFLYGEAAFDIGGKLNFSEQSLSIKNISSPNHEHLDSLTSFLCCHYLHPLESVTKGNALATVLDYIFETKDSRTDTLSFWKGWIERINYGYQWLAEKKIANQHLLGRNTGKLAGNRYIFEGGARTMSVSNDNINISATNSGERIFATAKNSVNSFFGYLESLTSATEKDITYLQIAGWAVDRAGARPPIQILFCHHDDVISLHRTLTIRRDVAETLSQKIAPRCGFTFHVDKKYIQDAKNCRLIFISSTNEAHIMPLLEGCVHFETAVNSVKTAESVE
jgi:capsular polysaccharide export protein